LRKYIINSIEDLPRNARVGTSSLRRASQLRHSRPDLEILELRGNIDTRLRKLYEGDYDAIVLASAGLRRLGFDQAIAAYLSTMEMLPAVGQGALAIETRDDDQRVNILLEVLNHQPTRYATEAERAVLRSLGGGCAVPIAAHAQFKKNRISHKLVVEALVADVEGRNLIRRQIAGQAQDAERLGVKLAEMLIEAGARDLLPRIGGVETSGPVQRGEGSGDGENGAAGVADPPTPTIVAPSEDRPATKTENGAAPPAPAIAAAVEGEPAIRAENGIAHASPPVPAIRTENGIAHASPPVPATKTENGAAPPSLAILAPSEVELAIKSGNGAAPSAPPAPAIAVRPESGHAIKTENGVAPPQTAVMVEHAVGAENGETLRPLHGRRVIVTRAVKQSGEMTRSLAALGAEVISCPTIEIKAPSSWEPLDRALVHLSWYDWLVFTSVNGVEYFLWRMDALGHGRGELGYHRVCAVGRKTAEKLESENIMVDLTPERFTADAVVEAFTAHFAHQRLYGSRMLLPASRATRDVIRPAMEKIGVYVEVVEAYRTVAPAASDENVVRLFRDAGADYIVFTSPSTVDNLAGILETDHLAPYLANTRVACIGPVTAEAAQSHGLTVHIQPEEHTGQAIVTAIVADSYEKRYAAFL
jgi:uroporphyrinogen III methyltransferase/synthase